MKLNEEQIAKVVNWWADKIKRPTFSILTTEERLDPHNAPASFAELLAAEFHKDAPDDQIEAFKAALVDTLRQQDVNSLDVDYSPCGELARAARQAIPGFNDMTTFPYKTHMVFEADGSITVKSGYGAAWETL